jgi:transposase
MKVVWKNPSDPRRLRELSATTRDAEQRDRYRVVLLAGEGSAELGQFTREQIRERVGRSRQFVDEWVGRYRKGGIEKLLPLPHKGRDPKLSTAQQEELCRMIDAGPTPEEAIAAYNGPILREKIEKEFNKTYTLDAVYKLLHRLGYNDLMPRPKHPDTDPAALEAFKKKISRKSWRRSKPHIQTSVC